jgi:hypothetical protein
LGFGSESMSNFLSGSPDSVGFDNDDVNLVSAALEEAGTEGVVIVGMHAPPINPMKTDLPNCLRETARQVADEHQVLGFLARVSDEMTEEELIGTNPEGPEDGWWNRHKTWPRSGTPYMHSGSVDDLLDYGTAVGNKQAVVEMFAGKGFSRPVNLVLSGHGHNRIEYRLRWNNESNQLETYMDHYLDNPDTYYPLKHANEDWWATHKHSRYLVKVTPGAPPNGRIQHLVDHRVNIWQDQSYIEVPPYATPLSTAGDAKDWWARHSPVITQTASLGQCDNTRASVKQNAHFPGPNHQGFRMIQIVDNVIRKVHYIHSKDVKGPYPLSWEGARPPREGLPELHIPPGMLDVILVEDGPGSRRPPGGRIRDHRRGGGGA